MKTLNELGVFSPKILLPNKKIEQNKWPVIACDQYSSQQVYWDQLQQFVGQSASTLNLIYPEIFLEKPDFNERVREIQNKMQYFLSENIFEEFNSFILVERTLPSGDKRIGIMMAVDLEQYEYSQGARSLIRPTEGTIVSRLPVRVEIRRNAPLELPHILLLIDDQIKSLIEPLFDVANNFQVVYDTDLPMQAGHVKGYLIPEKYERHLASQLNILLTLNNNKASPLLFAVGDGNHSLAAAKAYWNEIKDRSSPDHPARFALVELINLHDNALTIEPIHRVIFNVDKNIFFEELNNYIESKGSRSTSAASVAGHNSNTFIFIYQKEELVFKIEPKLPGLACAIIQDFIDSFIAKHPESTVDYIHGEEAVHELTANPKNIGVMLPEIVKQDIIPFVEKNGPLPRKYFSLGTADEKRFYFESRLIK